MLGLLTMVGEGVGLTDVAATGVLLGEVGAEVDAALDPQPVATIATARAEM